jgi:RNA polymerase sigma factor (sigma-70 family)
VVVVAEAQRAAEVMASKLHYWFSSVLEWDDAVQIGMLACLSKLDTYDEHRGTAFRYFTSVARLAILQATTRARKAPQPLTSATKRLVDPCPTEPYDDTPERLRVAIADLSPQAQDVLRRRFYGHMTMAQIAKLRGCSEANVNQIEKRAIRALQGAL